MHGCPFLHATLSYRSPEGALQPTLIHGLVSVFLEGGKQPDWVTMAHPVQSQELQATFWQRYIPILASFACVNVNELAFSIDVFDLQAAPSNRRSPQA